MKITTPKYIPLFISLVAITLSLSAQNVTNVEFWQEGKNVYISYDLDKTADISVHVSSDGGKTFSSPLKQVIGGVGKGITSGKKTIVWDVLSEYDKLVGEEICFRVTALSGICSFTINGVAFNMIQVEGGTFTMGATPEQHYHDSDEMPTHSVTLTSFYVGETEVTQALWQAVMGSNPSYFKGDTNPVEEISWHDCHDFVRKLNSLTGKSFRLPTEAEWEFAARGGNKSKGFQYSGSNKINEVAWYNENSGSKTHPVASKAPNELGIYDMSGNVREWCQDWYGDYRKSAQTNPIGPSSGSGCVDRGGSWYCRWWDCRSANRNDFTPDSKLTFLGVRLVLSE